jgi:hypothetical protein
VQERGRQVQRELFACLSASLAAAAAFLDVRLGHLQQLDFLRKKV